MKLLRHLETPKWRIRLLYFFLNLFSCSFKYHNCNPSWDRSVNINVSMFEYFSAQMACRIICYKTKRNRKINCTQPSILPLNWFTLVEQILSKMTKNKNWMIKLTPYKTYKILLLNDQMTNDVKMSKPNLPLPLLPFAMDALRNLSSEQVEVVSINRSASAHMHVQ